MSHGIDCPSCGGTIQVASRAARVASCPYCSSTVIVNEAAVRLLGKMALLVDTPSCLAVGWPARCLGEEIEVLGRIQYRYGAGLWDEWWIRFVDKDRHAWISQDESRYMLELPLKTQFDAAWLEQLEPGDKVRLQGSQLWVEEKGEAVMVGAQGVLPIEAAPDARMRYIDLSDNKRKATIEFFPRGTQLVFSGRYLGRRELQSQAASPGDTAAASLPYAPPALGHPGDASAQDAGLGGSAGPLPVTCTSCSGTIQVHDVRGTVMVKCGYCGAALDVTVPGPARLLYQAEKARLPFPLPLGAKGTLRGVSYVFIGRLRYRQREEGVDYHWDVAQLYSPQKGYAFLELENGHWLLFTPLKHAVHFDPRSARRGRRVAFEGQSYRVFERGSCQIDYVEGELSWVARAGDRLQFMDAIRPPYLLSAEWSQDEMEWSLGVYLRPQTVARAFGVAVDQLPALQGVAPAQPFSRSVNQRTAALAGTVVAILLLLLAGLSWMKKGVTVLEPQTVSSREYLSEAGYLSPAFQIPDGRHICKFTASSPELSNQWVGMAIAVLDEEENVLMDTDSEVEYYHGVESGESWSEGSTRDYVFFRLDGPARYRLNVFGQTGRWSSVAGDQPSTLGPAVTMAVQCDVAPARYYLLAAALAALFPLWEWGRQVLFQASRWGDDDD